MGIIGTEIGIICTKIRFLTGDSSVRRMTYKNGVKQFSLDPPLKRRRFRIDHDMITAWVIVFRLPYFLRSHLYLEYRFSFDLVQGQ